MPNPNEPIHDRGDFGNLPMQPTGSGPADLEVAYEQMRLLEEAESKSGTVLGSETAAPVTPFEDTPATAESEAHPS